MPGRNFMGMEYRYGFNGMEKDNEAKGTGNSYDFGARMHDPRLGRWLSVDPKAAKYPGMSPYNFAGNSPMYFIDPGGETLKVAGHINQAVNDLKSMVPENYRSAIQVSESGEIFIDASKLPTDNSNPGAGYALVNDLINSNNNFEYRVANDNNGKPLVSVNGTIENNSKTPRMEFNKTGNQLPEGVDGQVIIAKDASFTAKNGQEENRSSVVFHELQESYERTDNELPYMYIYPNNRSKEDPDRKGAHGVAIEKAKDLTPEAKSVSGTEGQLKDAELKK
jgi:RHS repeat-associated protein